jgi:hypothetical protein
MVVIKRSIPLTSLSIGPKTATKTNTKDVPNSSLLYCQK